MKLLAIDGNSIISRAFYGVRGLSTKDGRPTNGIYGFLSILFSLLDREKPDNVAVAFDLKSPTFRHEKYDKYKAGRKPTPPELIAQMEPLKEILRFMGYTVIECKGYEADDILGTLSRICSEAGETCVIATGDRDSLQLVSKSTRVLLASTVAGRPNTTDYTEEKIMEEYHVCPTCLIDIKAIMGDPSDNIPGVAGIGKKGAGDLIEKFQSIKYIYENIDEIDLKEPIREKLKASHDMAFLSYDLGTIDKFAPIETNLKFYENKPRDDIQLVLALSSLEMFKIIDKLALSNVSTVSANAEIKTAPDIIHAPLNITDDIAAFAGKKIAVAVDVYNDELLFALCDGENVGAFLQTEQLIKILKSDHTEKILNDSKAVYSMLFSKNIVINSVVFDTTLAGYLVSPSSKSYELDRLIEENSVIIPEINGMNINDEENPPEQIQTSLFDTNINESNEENIFLLAKNYLSLEACKIYFAGLKMEQELANTGMTSLLSEIELPLAKVLFDMEQEGFLIDSIGMLKFSDMLKNDIAILEKEIHDLVGYEFNIASPKQLGVALFEKLELKTGKKTKTGYSTGAEVLDNLRGEHQVIEKILLFRQYSKLKSTYCDGLLNSPQKMDEFTQHLIKPKLAQVA